MSPDPGAGATSRVAWGLAALPAFWGPGNAVAVAGPVEFLAVVGILLALGLVAALVLLARGRRRLAVVRDQAERALAEQRADAERLRTLAENSPEVVARFDRRLRHTYVNEYGARVYGKRPEEVVGKTNAELGMPPDKVAYWKEQFEQVFATRRQRTVDFEFDGPLGHQHFSSLFVPEFDGRGEVESILAITRDVSELRRAERAVREERDFMAAVLDVAASVVVVFDRDGRLVRCNRACEAATGYSADELLGMSYRDFVPDEERPGVERTWHQLAMGDFPNQHVNHWRRKDGTRRLIAWSNTAIADEGGNVRYVVGTGIDITERARAEAALRDSEARFRQLADAMPQVVWTARPDGTVDYYNERVHELSGARRRGDGSWDWAPVLHPEDVEPTMRAWTLAVRTGTRYQLAHRVRRSDGSLHWYLSRGEPVRDESGRVVRWFGTATDIDEQKHAEEAMREADRRKTEFLGMLSHELRNPLAPIRNSLYVLDRAAPGGAQARRAHEVIARQVDHLARLVDDLLDVTRITRGKIRLQRERVELCDLIRRAAEDHRTVFADRGLTLAFDEPCPRPLLADGDPTRLAQVIGNLLGNAAKFTPRGGRVSVRLEAAGATAAVRIRDTGTGIPPGLIDRLFEPFVQAEATLARSQGGLGLGLALVKGLVELHGGTVSARSDGPGRGAEFTFTLPLATDGRVSFPVAPPVGRADIGALRVLLIEDNVDAAESLKEALEFGGHDVALANAGPDGIATAREFRPHVVLCDIGLPGMDGYEVARAFRADPLLRQIPLIALSGYAQPEDLARSRDAGFRRHLTKPPDLDVLERALAEAGTAAGVARA